MAESTTNITQVVSDGTVTIAVEKYQELLASAAEKAPIIYNQVVKTAAIQASDNQALGSMLIGFGASVTVIGGLVLRHGLKQAKAL